MNNEEKFYDSQRLFDEEIVERKLTPWLELMVSKMGFAEDCFKKYRNNGAEARLIRAFYDNAIQSNYNINDAQAEIEALNMLNGVCYKHYQRILRLGEEYIGYNQMILCTVVRTNLMATQSVLEELTNKAAENADFRTLFATFIKEVNIFTDQEFDSVGKMIDEYEYANDRIFTNAKLTVIKKARNRWAHPEEITDDDQKIIDKGIGYMKEILNKIK